MNEENNQLSETQPIVQPPPALPEKKPSKSILILVGTALVLTGITVLLFYLYQKTKLEEKIKTTPSNVPTATPTVIPSTSKISEISESTDLETIEKEITETEVGSPEADFTDLDSQAEQL